MFLFFISFDLNLDVFIQLSILKYNLGKSCIKSLWAIILLCENLWKLPHSIKNAFRRFLFTTPVTFEHRKYVTPQIYNFNFPDPYRKVFLAPNVINDKQISLNLSQVRQEICIEPASDISAMLVAHILCGWITCFLIS